MDAVVNLEHVTLKKNTSGSRVFYGRHLNFLLQGHSEVSKGFPLILNTSGGVTLNGLIDISWSVVNGSIRQRGQKVKARPLQRILALCSHINIHIRNKKKKEKEKPSFSGPFWLPDLIACC